MVTTTDLRLVELKALQNLADRTWGSGVCISEGAGQYAALGISSHLYADLILTLLEDGYLYTRVPEIRSGLRGYIQHRGMAERDFALNHLWTSQIYLDMSVTYRGLRRIDELRDQLRRDRILERFGILLDGRYIVSDLIDFLERVNGEAVSLLFADVDDFKRFNSDYGYKAGDAVLRHVFRIIRQAVGDQGEVYRRGGEEIVTLLPYYELDRSKDLAERIREEVANSVVSHGGEELRVTLSIGVAASPPCDPDGPGLEAHAESALKKAKNGGKDRVVG